MGMSIKARVKIVSPRAPGAAENVATPQCLSHISSNFLKPINAKNNTRQGLLTIYLTYLIILNIVYWAWIDKGNTAFYFIYPRLAYFHDPSCGYKDYRLPHLIRKDKPESFIL